MTDKSSQLDTSNKTILPAPDITVDVREVFGIDIDMQVPAFSMPDERTPDVDGAYVFDPDTTLAILAGLCLQPPGDRAGLSRHRQIDPHRTGRGAAELAMRADQP
jgi:hypothetical protein